MFKKQHLAYPLIAIILISSGVYIERVRSNGQNPTWDELLGMFNVPWFNASTGINAPEYYINNIDRTVLLSGQNATGATAYVGFDSNLEYLPNYFLCDGVADDVEINAAIAFVGAMGGGLVHLGACLTDVTYYDLTASIVDGGYDNIILEGSGYNTVLRAQNAFGDIPVILVDGRIGWTIRDLAIDGNFANNPREGGNDYQNGVWINDSSDCVVRNLYVHDCPDVGIAVIGGEGVCVNILVDENTVEACHWHQIMFWNNVIRSKIINNYCKDSGAPGDSDIPVERVIGDSPSDRNIVAHNILYNSNVHGITVFSSDYVRVNDNMVINPGGVGIIVESNHQNTTGNGVIDNIVEGAGGAGIAATASVGKTSFDLTISGNTVSGCVGSTIDILRAHTDLIISDNMLDGSRDGIYLEGYTTNLTNAVITGNSISNMSRWGIGTYQTNFINCKFDNNGFSNIVSHIFHISTVTYTNTKFPMAQYQFTEAINGAIVTTSPTGVAVDAITEGALAWGQLPPEAQWIIRIKIWAVATGTPIGAGGQMHLAVTLNAGTANAAYNTASKSWAITDLDGADTDYVVNDVVSWVILRGDVGNELDNLRGGDSFELFVLYNSGADPDGATYVVFRYIEIEYV